MFQYFMLFQNGITDVTVCGLISGKVFYTFRKIQNWSLIDKNKHRLQQIPSHHFFHLSSTRAGLFQVCHRS